MKHLFTLKSLLLVLFAVLGGVNVWGQTWTRCSTVDELLKGGTFIIGYEATANSGEIVPMQNTGSATTTAAGYLYSGATSGTTGATTINMASVTETSLYEVTIAASSTVSGAITIKCPSGYVGNTNTKNNLKFFASESATTSFTPTVGANDIFTLKITANTTYTTLQYNTSSPRFAVYGGTQKNVVIYKKQVSESSVEAPTFTVPSGTYTETQTVKVDNYSSDYIYAYTTDGSEPAFSGLEVSNGTKYDHEAGIQISSSCTLKMIAVDGYGNTSSIGSATYTLPIVFSSLEDLVAADLTTGTLVTVSFTDVPIKEIYTTSGGNRNGVYFDIQKDGKDIEIFYQEVPKDWVKEGTLSGTMTCPWKKYNGTWELAPVENTWDWNNLTYKAPAVVKDDATLEFTSKTSLLVNESDAYTVTYNGDGTLSAESSDPSVATVTVSGSTVTVNALAKGEAKITVSAPSTSNYYAVEKSYVLYVSAPLTPAENGYETVDFTQIEPYCSLGSGANLTMENYEGTSFNIVFAKPQNSNTPTKYYKKGDAVRAYTGNTMTITGAENILGVKVNYVSDPEFVDSEEEITGLGTKEVVITSSKTCRFTSVDVYYKGVVLTATDGTDYYATFSSDKAVEFVDATVYTVDVNGSALVLNEVASKQVPANTGVLIKTASTKALYKYIDAAAALENNKLVAASVAMEGNKKFYKLAYGDWTNKADLGFYWGADNGAAFTAKAGGAYLAVPAAAGVKAFIFGDLGDEETAIESVEAETANEEIFDLSGRKVSKAEKGLYIINGKKVVK